MNRREYISARLNKRERRLIDAATTASGETVSDLLRGAVVAEARRRLAEAGREEPQASQMGAR